MFLKTFILVLETALFTFYINNINRIERKIVAFFLNYLFQFSKEAYTHNY